MSKPSVILMGSKPASVVALSIILERGWHVPYVVISRNVSHSWITGPTLEGWATERGIKVIRQSELPVEAEADFVISYMYRNLVKPRVLALARRAAVNFHAGPLPEFGGWAFYNVAILENSPEYGCTCHYMDASFDTGPLLRVRRFPINAREETACSLEQKAQEEMIRLFIDFCQLAESGDPLPIEEQDKGRMRYLNREEFEALKEIPANSTDEEIERRARAFWYPPYDCAFVRVGGSKVQVVPKIARDNLAVLLHSMDFENLKAAARAYTSEADELVVGQEA